METARANRGTLNGSKPINPARNEKVVNDSESSIYASEAVFSETGLLSHYTLRSSEEYIYLAQPTLPSLSERAAMSSMKDLHELSLLLAEDEETETETEEFLQLEELTKLSKLNCRYNSINDLEVTIRTGTDENFVAAENPKKNERELEEMHEVREANKMKTKANESELEEMDEAGNTTNMKTKANESELEEMDEVRNIKMKPKANIRSASKAKKNAKESVLKEVFQQLLQIVSLVLRKIDDYYLFSLLLLVGLLVYLIYILFIDINIYVNEELRYLAKMRSANFVGKCFYYIMRICHVPIF